MNTFLIITSLALLILCIYFVWDLSRHSEMVGELQDENKKLLFTLEKANIQPPSSIHLPRKYQYTCILEFVVLDPQNDMESVGERLKLSTFGEYCPDASLRGYSLYSLLLDPESYRPSKIVQMGEVFELDYNDGRPCDHLGQDWTLQESGYRTCDRCGDIISRNQ
jgi:hypothetical protein